MNTSKTAYIPVSVAAQRWNISERSVRHYCAQGRIEGAWVEGRSWKIPFDAQNQFRQRLEYFRIPY